MEVKYKLDKPYTQAQKEEFTMVYGQNCKGLFNEIFLIVETVSALEAWGKTDEEKTAERQANFENKFLSTSKGNYRLEPKGYANAQQSIDTINNMVNALGGLTQDIAQMMLFYETPDFSKEEECTEEWLVQHQYSIDPMTKEEWTTFYIEFTTKYAQKRYQQELLAQQGGGI